MAIAKIYIDNIIASSNLNRYESYQKASMTEVKDVEAISFSDM